MWSNPDVKWDGFQPVQYLLDTTKVLGLPFARGNKNETNPSEAVHTTLSDVLRETANWQIKNVETGFDFGHSNGHQITISADPESMVLSSVAFNCQLMKTLVDFRLVSVDPFDVVWFWYAKAEVLDDPHTSYAFFVVHDNKIVNERVTFADAHGYGFDPTVFHNDDTPEIWSDEKGWNDAQIRFWYRKFYRETMTGQLMVLRSDEPELFHYPEGELVRRLYPQQPDIDVVAQLQAAFSALDKLGKK